MIYSKQIEVDVANNNDILYLNTINSNSLLKMDEEAIIDLKLQDTYNADCGTITITNTHAESVQGNITYTLSEVYKFSGTTTPTLNGSIITVSDTSYEGALRITATATNATTSRIILIKATAQPYLTNTTVTYDDFTDTDTRQIVLTEDHQMMKENTIGWFVASGETAVCNALPTIVNGKLDFTGIHYEGLLTITVSGLTENNDTLYDTVPLFVECGVEPEIEITSPTNPITDTASTQTALTYTSNVVLTDVNWEMVSYEPSGDLPNHGIPTISADTSGNPILIIKATGGTAADNHFEGTCTIKVSGTNVHGNPSTTQTFDVNCSYSATYAITYKPSQVMVEWNYNGNTLNAPSSDTGLISGATFTHTVTQHKISSSTTVNKGYDVTTINTATTAVQIGTITDSWHDKTASVPVYQRACGAKQIIEGTTLLYYNPTTKDYDYFTYDSRLNTELTKQGYSPIAVLVNEDEKIFMALETFKSQLTQDEMTPYVYCGSEGISWDTKHGDKWKLGLIGTAFAHLTGNTTITQNITQTAVNLGLDISGRYSIGTWTKSSYNEGDDFYTITGGTYVGQFNVEPTQDHCDINLVIKYDWETDTVSPT